MPKSARCDYSALVLVGSNQWTRYARPSGALHASVNDRVKRSFQRNGIAAAEFRKLVGGQRLADVIALRVVAAEHL